MPSKQYKKVLEAAETAVRGRPYNALAELKGLLAEYPMDDEQRASILANAKALPEGQVRAMIQRMRTTLERLETGLAELKKLLPFEKGVEFTADTTVAASYEISVPAGQKAECA
jgi:hypothetical protein